MSFRIHGKRIVAYRDKKPNHFLILCALAPFLERPGFREFTSGEIRIGSVVGSVANQTSNDDTDLQDENDMVAPRLLFIYFFPKRVGTYLWSLTGPKRPSPQAGPQEPICVHLAGAPTRSFMLREPESEIHLRSRNYCCLRALCLTGWRLRPGPKPFLGKASTPTNG